MNETTLHTDIKWLYSRSLDQLEKKVGKYIIDIVRDDCLIEVQTNNFSAIRNKLEFLIKNHRVRLIHPIIKDKWIIKVNPQFNNDIHRRLSPKHCSYLDFFKELISFPKMISHPNFTIEIILIQIEEIREKCGKASWRRNGWRICDKKLLRVIESKIFNNPIDFLYLIPKNIESPFTNLELAKSLKIPLNLAQKMSYCLRKLELIEVVDKIGNALLFDYK